MEFRVLGELEVVDDGRVVALTGKPRALLGVLLVSANEVVSAERLIDALWADRPPATAQTALQVHVSQLRKLLGAKRIETRSPGYRLLVGPEELDSSRFERLLVEGRSEEALALWRGRPLAEFEYEPWAASEVARLQELRLAADEARVEAALARGDGPVAELEALVRAHPLRERPRAQLMRALYAAGRQADALAVYQETRKLLVEELGIEPGPELQELYRQILNQDAALAHAAREQPKAPSRHEERKVVTVLFCDLVGFTPRAEAMDPEDVSALLSRFHVQLRAELERFGGTVEKFAGDAVMALFGAPSAREDDAERAVRAAMAIRGWIAEAEDGLQVRIGVSTGVALVRLGASPAEGEAMAVGDVVNTAARLQQVAPQGAILVGEQTFRATRRAIAYERVDPVEVKGKSEPVAVWIAKGARDAATESERPTTPFVGRARELALLEQTFERVVDERSAQLVTILGEPGIGKTRLLTEFRSRVDAGDVLVRHGRCLAYGDGITFWALGQVVKEQTGILESDTPEIAADKLGATLEALAPDADRQWLFARLAPLVGAARTDVSAEQDESFAAWRAFLEGIAAARPLVLLLEDLHWADSALLEFVESLVDWVSDVPLLVVGTARPELFERAPAWSGGKRNASTLALGPLTHEDTAAVVGELLPDLVLSAETQAMLLERAAGNPLYAEEFVRLVAERGGVEVGVPDSVQALIAARLDTLPPERKELVHAAAVVGKTFWAGALAAITRASKESVLASLHELGRKELVRRVRTSSIEGDTEYLFWHVLVRDVAYEQIPRAERSRMHVGAAEWIERIAGGRVTDHAEFLAHHYRTALEIGRTSGAAVDERLLDHAIESAKAAGDRARHLDMAAASRYYREALDLLRTGDARRRPLLLGWVHASLTSSAFPFDVLEAELGEGIADFRARGDDVATADALRELAFLQIFTGAGADKRRRLLEEAREILERRDPTRELALVYEQLTNYFANMNDPVSTLEIAQRTLDLLAQFGLRDEELIARSRVLAARARVGDADAVGEALDLVETVRAPESGFGSYARVIALNNLGSPVEMFGDVRGAIDSVEAAIELCDSRGLRAPGLWQRANSAFGYYEIGDWERVLERGTFVCSAAGAPPRARGIAFPLLARVRAARGELEEAREAIEQSLALAREQEDGLWFVFVTAALVAAASGDAALARAYLDEGDSSPEPPQALTEFLADYARVSAFAGRLDPVRRLLTTVDRETPYYLRQATAAEAVVAETEGRLDDGAAMYEEAARLSHEGGYVVEHAHACAGLARCRIALGRPAAAEAPLGQARAVYARLGARTFLAELDALERVRA